MRLPRPVTSLAMTGNMLSFDRLRTNGYCSLLIEAEESQ